MAGRRASIDIIVFMATVIFLVYLISIPILGVKNSNVHEKECEKWLENFTHQYGGKVMSDEAIVEFEGINTTPAMLSFKDFVYSRQTSENTKWVVIPFYTGKSFGVVPLPVTDKKTTYVQNYPIMNVTLEKIIGLANETKVLYYDNEHLFIPVEVNGARIIAVWTLDNEYIKIKTVEAGNDSISIVLYCPSSE